MMGHCRICDVDLDNQPTAGVEVDERWWDTCLPCGVAVGGVFEGITLTPDGVAEAIADIALAAQAVADLLSSTTDIGELLARYRR